MENKMTIMGEITILAEGLKNLSVNPADGSDFNVQLNNSLFFRDLGESKAIIDIAKVYVSLPIPEDFFFPSGDIRVQTYGAEEKVEEKWEQNFIKWAKNKYKQSLIINLISPDGNYITETIDLEKKIENPVKFRKDIWNLLPSTEVIDKEEGYCPDIYLDISSSVDKESLKICDILKNYPSVRTKTLMYLLKKKGHSAEDVLKNFLVEKYGFNKTVNP